MNSHVNSHRDLKFWQTARKTNSLVFKLVNKLPNKEIMATNVETIKMLTSTIKTLKATMH